VPQRKFVAGEKFWIVGSAVKDDGIILVAYSDPYSDVRYYGQLRFPFQKHSIPPVDDVLKTIAEVVTVQPADNSAGGTAPAPVPDTQPEKAFKPIAPPSAPPDAPPPARKTIEKGQTKEVVVAILGQPSKMVKLGTKEIYYYPDMKVIFVSGKVTDVQ
jgi:hypothetical protein